MAFNVSNPIGTGSDSELLELTRAAIVNVTLHGQAYSAGFGSLTRADLPTLHRQVEWLEARINATSTSRANKNNYASRKRAS
jgi:hypothetical protein